jgi:hypothetical protein
VTTALQVRGLLRLRKWAGRVGERPSWRSALGIAWKFVPAALLVGLQPLVALFADRVFSYPQLFRAMPDVVGWLILAAVLGAAAGTARVLIVWRSKRPRPHTRPMAGIEGPRRSGQRWQN